MAWMNPVNIVAFFASIGGIVFLIHRLCSEPFSLNIVRSEDTTNTQILFKVTNLTGYSLNTEFTASYVIGDNGEKPISNVTTILSPNVLYDFELISLRSISDKNNLRDPNCVNHNLKLIIQICMKNNWLKVQKLNNTINSEWIYSPRTRTFNRIK